MGFDVTGALAAVFTPMNDAVAGTTGESGLMSLTERKLLLEAWMKAARPLNVKVIVHIGGAPLPDVIELAKHAEQEKVDAVLTLPDLYFKSKTIEPLVRYLELVSKAAPSLPLLYYHSPKLTGVDVKIGEFFALATSRIPYFKGIKADWSVAVQLTDIMRPDQRVLICNHNIAPAALVGYWSSTAVITNIFPSRVHRILEAAKNGDMKTAGKEQTELNRIVNTITSFNGPFMYGEYVPPTKLAMEIVTGVKVGPPRQPLTPHKEQISRLREQLKSLGY